MAEIRKVSRAQNPFRSSRGKRSKHVYCNGASEEELVQLDHVHAITHLGGEGTSVVTFKDAATAESFYSAKTTLFSAELATNAAFGGLELGSDINVPRQAIKVDYAEEWRWYGPEITASRPLAENVMQEEWQVKIFSDTLRYKLTDIRRHLNGLKWKHAYAGGRELRFGPGRGAGSWRSANNLRTVLPQAFLDEINTVWKVHVQSDLTPNFVSVLRFDTAKFNRKPFFSLPFQSDRELESGHVAEAKAPKAPETHGNVENRALYPLTMAPEYLVVPILNCCLCTCACLGMNEDRSSFTVLHPTEILTDAATNDPVNSNDDAQITYIIGGCHNKQMGNDDEHLPLHPSDPHYICRIAYGLMHAGNPKELHSISPNEILENKQKEGKGNEENEGNKQKHSVCYLLIFQRIDDAKDRADTAIPSNDVIAIDQHQLITDVTERNNVHCVYDRIAKHFSHTRYRPWPRIEAFLQRLPIGSVVLDIGCGNGKYGFCRKDIVWIGADRCRPLLECAVAKNCNLIDASHTVPHLSNYVQTAAANEVNVRNNTFVQTYPLDFVVADCIATGIRSDTADAVICIAVIHHLRSESRRIAAIRELLRIVRPGGQVLLYVWALDQDESVIGSRKFKAPDVLVPWKLQAKQDSAKQDSAKQDSAKQDSAKQDSAKQDSAKQDSAKQDSEKQDSKKQVSEKYFSEELLEEPGISETLMRYYHVFRRDELQNLCLAVEGLSIRDLWLDCNNWGILLLKN